MKKENHRPTIKASQDNKKSAKNLISPALSKLRNEINLLDQDIWSLLSKRFSIVEKIAKIKQELDISVYDGQRETFVLEEIKAKTADPKIANAITKLYKQLFSVSRQHQLLYSSKSLSNGHYHYSKKSLARTSSSKKKTIR